MSFRNIDFWDYKTCFAGVAVALLMDDGESGKSFATLIRIIFVDVKRVEHMILLNGLSRMTKSYHMYCLKRCILGFVES